VLRERDDALREVERYRAQEQEEEAKGREACARIDEIQARIDGWCTKPPVLFKALVLAELRTSGGKKSGKTRRNKDWHVASDNLLKDNPKLDYHAYVDRIIDEVKPPVDRRAVQNFAKRKFGLK
jgi:hypothetical protein